jgi:hypothetical protein
MGKILILSVNQQLGMGVGEEDRRGGRAVARILYIKDGGGGDEGGMGKPGSRWSSH